MRLTLILILGSLLIAGEVDATTILDFDTFSDSTILTNQYAGVAFSNTIVLKSGISLNELEFPPLSGLNVVSDDSGLITIQFASPVSAISGYFTYVERITLKAFGAPNKLLDSITSKYSSNDALYGDPGSSPNELVQVSSLTGISSFTIMGDPAGGSFTLDHLSYTPITTSEPQSVYFFLVFPIAIVGMSRLKVALLRLKSIFFSQQVTLRSE